jgi:hypothetical protein
MINININTDTDVKASDDSVLIQLLCFWAISIILLLFISSITIIVSLETIQCHVFLHCLSSLPLMGYVVFGLCTLSCVGAAVRR